MSYMKAVKRVNPKCYPKIFSISLICYLHEMMNVHELYCDNHFMMYINHIIRCKP